MLPTRAVLLSFRAIKDLAISHCTVGRKTILGLLAVGHYASWHPKMTIIRLKSRESFVFGVPNPYLLERTGARLEQSS